MWKDGSIKDFLFNVVTEQPANNNAEDLAKMPPHQQDAMDEMFRRNINAPRQKSRPKVFDARKAEAEIEKLDFDISALAGGMKLRHEQHEETMAKMQADHLESMKIDKEALEAKQEKRDKIQREVLRWADKVGALKHLIVEGDSVRIEQTVRPPDLHKLEDITYDPQEKIA